MGSEPLRNHPNVIRLFDTMEQSRAYAEKMQFQQVVAHLDELTAAIGRLQQEVAALRQQSENMAVCATAEKDVAQVGTELESTKSRMADIAKKAVSACREGGRKALVSTLRAAHIPHMLSGLQKTFEGTGQRLREGAEKSKTASAEWDMAKIHFRNVGNALGGSALRAEADEKSTNLLDSVSEGLLWLANAFGQMGRTTGQLREKIPDLKEGAAAQRQSVRRKIKGRHFRADVQKKERQTAEAVEL